MSCIPLQLFWDFFFNFTNFGGDMYAREWMGWIYMCDQVTVQTRGGCRVSCLLTLNLIPGDRMSP